MRLEADRVVLVPTGETQALSSGNLHRFRARDREGHPLGVLDIVCQGPVASFACLEIKPQRRGYGLGGEAVRAIEGWASRRGARIFKATVAETDGLGVYFWLRLGYRPVLVRTSSLGTAALEMERRLV